MAWQGVNSWNASIATPPISEDGEGCRLSALDALQDVSAIGAADGMFVLSKITFQRRRYAFFMLDADVSAIITRN
jgi:hypothetical protein